MTAPLNTCTAIEQRGIVQFLWAKGMAAKDIHKQMLPMYGEHYLSCLSLSNGITAQGGPRPPLGVSSILPSLGRLLSNFYILASLHLPPLHLPNAVWVSLWGVFLLAH